MSSDAKHPRRGALPGPGDDAIVAVVRQSVPSVVAVYRFGSTVDGTTHADSDVDVALLAPGPLDPLLRFELQEEIAGQLGRNVDLIDLRSASTVMAVQVVGKGRVLYESDAAERGRFEDLALARYVRFNEERREILERVVREGTVYGR